MANLGTLDRMKYAGAQSVANAIVPSIIKNGTTSDKLAMLLGAYVGDRMAQRRRNKDNAKLDDIVAQAKSNPAEPAFTVGEDGSIRSGNGGISPQEYSFIMNGQEPVVSAGVDNLEKSTPELAQAIETVNNQKMPSTGNVLNPNYNMEYIRDLARKQGISSGVLADRESALQKDIAQNANAFYLPQIQQKLYGTKDKPATTDSILEGMSLLGELEKYSPETAKAYQNLAVNSLQGNQKFEQAKTLQQMKAINQAVTDARRLQNRIDYKNYTNNTSGKTNNTSGLKTADWLAMQKRHSELGASLQEKYPDGRLPLNDPDVQAYMTIGQTIGLGGTNNTRQNTAPVTNQPQQGARDVTGTPEAKKLQGETTKQAPVEANTADKYGFKNDIGYWDVTPAIAKIRSEYFDDQEAAQKKYGFKTYTEYVDWLLGEGE